jgi:hypothetical protein
MSAPVSASDVEALLAVHADIVSEVIKAANPFEQAKAQEEATAQEEVKAQEEGIDANPDKSGDIIKKKFLLRWPFRFRSMKDQTRISKVNHELAVLNEAGEFPCS